MKKTFQLTHPKTKYPRLVDSVRCDVRKYIKRERKKKLPEGVDFWDFDCKFGVTADEAKEIHVAELSKAIDSAEEQNLRSFYVEILVKPANRTKKPKSDSIENNNISKELAKNEIKEELKSESLEGDIKEPDTSA